MMEHFVPVCPGRVASELDEDAAGERRMDVAAV